MEGRALSKNAYNPLERFFLRFRDFPSVFKSTDALGKASLATNLLFPGLGNVITGTIEKGLVSFIAYFLLWTLGVWVGVSMGNGSVIIDGLTAAVFFLVLLIGIVFLYVSGYDAGMYEAKRRIHEHNYKVESFIYHGSIKAYKWVRKYLSDYKETYFKSSPKNRTLLILSFFVTGIPSIFMHKAVKGVVFFAYQVFALIWFILRGCDDIIGLILLNTRQNSTFVYGLLSLFIVLGAIVLWVVYQRGFLDEVREYNKGSRESFTNELKSYVDEKFYCVGLIVPILGALVFTVLPIAFMICTAFTNYSLRQVPGYDNFSISKGINIVWRGFEAFGRLFTQNSSLTDILNVFSWTMIWATLATFTCYFGGLFLAMLLNKKAIFGKVVWRSIFVVAMAMPQFVSLLVVRTMFMQDGVFNTLLMQMGVIEQGINFWADPFWSKFLIIVVNMWVGIPYYMLLTSGLLLNIPADLYEAADIEGANRFQKFKNITFPQVFYMTTPVLITGFVNNINNFNVIWFLTGGGTINTIGGNAGSNDILITWLYRMTMESGGGNEYNIAGCIGIIMFIVTATVSLSVFRNSKAYNAEEEYR